MDSAATTPATAEHAPFPEKAWEYVRIGLLLFAITAMEVGAYELAHRASAPGHEFFKSSLIPVLIVLSAIKFALVALYYMHLKWDGRLLKGIFTFSLMIAILVIVALMMLAAYQFKVAASYGPMGA
jgi:heme/copper-type cytochrome/quinol oxidase subunit 4